MLKYLRYVVLLGFLVAVVIYYNRSSDVAMKKSSEYLHNNVEFEGYVTGFEQSDNHAFGVIHLKLTKSNTPEFNKIIKNGIYPYRINGDIAEIYTTISADLDYYDTISVNSKSHEIEFKATKSHKRYVSDLYVIEDPGNIKYVKKKTDFE